MNFHFSGLDESNLNIYLTKIVDKALNTLKDCFCVDFEDDDRGLISTNLGRIASYYYLSHLTVQHFKQNMNGKLDLEEGNQDFLPNFFPDFFPNLFRTLFSISKFFSHFFLILFRTFFSISNFFPNFFLNFFRIFFRTFFSIFRILKLFSIYVYLI